MSEIWLRTGEATVLAREGQATDAMPEIVIGSIRGPVGQAFASMMGRSRVIHACSWCGTSTRRSQPPTMMTTKVTIKNMAYAELLGGVVQAAMGDAIVDCLTEDILPRDQADDLCMIITVGSIRAAPKTRTSTTRIFTAPTTKRRSSPSRAP